MIPNISQFIEQVVYERDIPKRDIIKAVEEGFEIVAPDLFEGRHDKFKVSFDPKTGELRYYALKKVVGKVKDENNEISKKEAEPFLKNKKETEEQDELDDDDYYLDDEEEDDYEDEPEEEEQAPVDKNDYVPVKLETKDVKFTRLIIQKAKNIIQDKVHDASRNAHFDYYNRRKGTIYTGTFSYETKNGDYIVNLGKLDGILLKSNRAVDETFRKGERLKVFIKDVTLMDKRIRIELSRLEAELIISLFTEEVPEIADGLVVVKAAVRDRIGRVKILVESTDRNVDAVGSCVGVRGSRVKNVIAELKEERIDIVPNSDEIRALALKALGSDEIEKLNIDVENKIIQVIVNKEKLPRFIGKKGQNVRLASKLIKWHIDIFEVSEYEKKFNVIIETSENTRNIFDKNDDGKGGKKDSEVVEKEVAEESEQEEK